MRTKHLQSAVVVVATLAVSVMSATSASADSLRGCTSHMARYDTEVGSGLAYTTCSSSSRVTTHRAVAYCISRTNQGTVSFGNWTPRSKISNAYCPGGWSAYSHSLEVIGG